MRQDELIGKIYQERLDFAQEREQLDGESNNNI